MWYAVLMYGKSSVNSPNYNLQIKEALKIGG